VVGPRPVFGSLALLGIVLARWAITTPPDAPRTVTKPVPLPAVLTNGLVLFATWLVVLPSVLSGVLIVLAPLRLDQLGGSGLVIGTIFLLAGALEAITTRALGIISDRRGRLAPIRIGVALAILAALILPLPNTVFRRGRHVDQRRGGLCLGAGDRVTLRRI